MSEGVICASIPDELAFIINDADDCAVLVDDTLFPLWEKIAPKTKIGRVIVVGSSGTIGNMSRVSRVDGRSLVGRRP